MCFFLPFFTTQPFFCRTSIPFPIPASHAEVIVEALPNVEGNLLGVVLFRPTDERIEGLKSGDHCGWMVAWG